MVRAVLSNGRELFSLILSSLAWQAICKYKCRLKITTAIYVLTLLILHLEV